MNYTNHVSLCFLLSIILYLSISSAYLQLQKRHTVQLKLLIFCSVLSNTGFSSLTCVTMIYLLHYLKHHVLLISLLSSNISMTTHQNKTHTFVWHIKWFLPFFFFLIILRKSEYRLLCSCSSSQINIWHPNLALPEWAANLPEPVYPLLYVLLIKFCHADTH